MSEATLLSQELDRLSHAAASCGGVDAAETRATLARLLSEDGRLPGARGHSVLNANGSPVELCITATADGLRVRGIGDPAFHRSSPAERYESSRQILESLPELRRSGELHALCARTIACNVPPDLLADYRNGVMWLASAVGGEGMALYVDAHPPGRAVAWARARQWLASILGNPAEMLAAAETLSRHAGLCSIGLEAASPADARAKLHVRLAHTARFEDLGVELLRDERVRAFVLRAAGPREFPLSGVVIGVGASVRSGAIRDAKIDLAGTYLELSPSAWTALAEWCADTFGIREVPMASLLADGRLDVAFIGLGLDTGGAYRLNVYLKAVRP